HRRCVKTLAGMVPSTALGGKFSTCRPRNGTWKTCPPARPGLQSIGKFNLLRNARAARASPTGRPAPILLPPHRPAVPPAPTPGGEAAGAGARHEGPRPLPPLGSDPEVRASTPPAILEAQATFWRDLPELLRERRGQWVAYHGAHRIGVGATKAALW